MVAAMAPAQNVIYELDNFACATGSDVKNILLLAHCFQHRPGLFKNCAFAADHNRQCPIDRALRPTAYGRIQEVNAAC